jgi:hypothetical protein
MTLFNVLVIIVTSFCVSLDISCQELGRPNFLEGVFGLTQVQSVALEVVGVNFLFWHHEE